MIKPFSSAISIPSTASLNTALSSEVVDKCDKDSFSFVNRNRLGSQKRSVKIKKTKHDAQLFGDPDHSIVLGKNIEFLFSYTSS